MLARPAIHAYDNERFISSRFRVSQTPPSGGHLKTTCRLFSLLLLISAGAFAQIGYQADPNAKEKETLLLRDFHPESMLHIKATPVERAKFPVFDVHQHLNDALGIGSRMDPKDAVALMDKLNIKSVVILTGGWGAQLGVL